MPNGCGSATVAYRRYDAGSQLGFHHHETASICLLMTGAYDEQIRGRLDSHLPGDVMFCPRGEAHAQGIGQYGAGKLIITLGDPELQFLEEHCELHEAPFRHVTAAAVIGRDIIAEIENPDSGSADIVDAHILDLMNVFVQLDAETYISSRHWLWKVVDLIQSEADRPIVMSQLAKAADRHPATVTRQFRAIFGCSPFQYQLRLRLGKAALLIRRGVPLAEVAHSTGFADQAHLTRSFHRARGTTPGALRGR